MASNNEAATQWLLRQHQDRSVFTGFPESCAPTSLDQAYSIQDDFVQARKASLGDVVGWKIALSNPAMQAMCHLSAPIAGRLFSGQIRRGSARIKAADFVHLLLEFEIAVELNADLRARAGHQFQPGEVAEAVGAVRPAFELVDDRHADYGELGEHALQLVADNAWNQGAVLGEARTQWQALDLASIGGKVWIDGELSGEGHGRDLMGHPLNALAWLATHANHYGHAMQAGDIAILGTMVTSRFPSAGQTLVFELDGFEPLSLAVD